MLFQIINMGIFIGSVIVSYYYVDFQAISSVSDMYVTLITPAKFTFRIWGVIYAMALLCNVLLFSNKYREYKLILIQTLLAILNATWVILWTRQYIILSWGIIVSMLVILVLTVSWIHFSDRLIKEYFYMYTGWLAVATSVQTGVLMMYLGIAVPPIVYALLIGVLAYECCRVNSPSYYAVTIWALVGIYLQNTNEQFGFLILGVSMILIIMCGINLIKKKKQATE